MLKKQLNQFKNYSISWSRKPEWCLWIRQNEWWDWQKGRSCGLMWGIC